MDDASTLSGWRRSSYSGPSGGDCVEMIPAATVPVRDSKQPAGPALAFTAGAWRAFLAGIDHHGGRVA